MVINKNASKTSSGKEDKKFRKKQKELEKARIAAEKKADRKSSKASKKVGGELKNVDQLKRESKRLSNLALGLGILFIVLTFACQYTYNAVKFDMRRYSPVEVCKQSYADGTVIQVLKDTKSDNVIICKNSEIASITKSKEIESKKIMDVTSMMKEDDNSLKALQLKSNIALLKDQGFKVDYILQMPEYSEIYLISDVKIQVKCVRVGNIVTIRDLNYRMGYKDGIKELGLR